MALTKSFLLREFEEPGTTVWRDVPDPIGLRPRSVRGLRAHYQQRLAQRARIRRAK